MLCSYLQPDGPRLLGNAKNLLFSVWSLVNSIRMISLIQVVEISFLRKVDGLCLSDWVSKFSHSGGVQGRATTPPHQKERTEPVTSWVRCSGQACAVSRKPRSETKAIWRASIYRLAWERLNVIPEKGMVRWKSGWLTLDKWKKMAGWFIVLDLNFYWNGWHELLNSLHHSQCTAQSTILFHHNFLVFQMLI